MSKTKRVARILVVDDERVNLYVVTKRLAREGYEVYDATNGQDAITLIEEKQPDLILLDIMMPGMDGLEVLERIRNVRDTRFLPVIMISAKDMVKDKVDALARGADDYLTKPINMHELIARVKAQLRIVDLQRRLVEAERLKVVYEMAGAVCHELSQPLTVLIGYTDMLLRQADEAAADRLKQVKDAADRAARIINRIQRIQRYETKPYSDQTNIIDLDRAVEEESLPFIEEIEVETRGESQEKGGKEEM